MENCSVDERLTQHPCIARLPRPTLQGPQRPKCGQRQRRPRASEHAEQHGGDGHRCQKSRFAPVFKRCTRIEEGIGVGEAPLGERYGQHRGEQNVGHRLKQKLQDEYAAACARKLTDADFPGTAVGTRGQQVDEVDACDEQNAAAYDRYQSSASSPAKPGSRHGFVSIRSMRTSCRASLQPFGGREKSAAAIAGIACSKCRVEACGASFT